MWNTAWFDVKPCLIWPDAVFDLIQVKELKDQVTSLQDILTPYEKWISTDERVADEALEISRQLEQCRVRNAGLTGSSNSYIS